LRLQKKWGDVVDHCTDALKISPGDVKALYRRALGYQGQAATCDVAKQKVRGNSSPTPLSPTPRDCSLPVGRCAALTIETPGLVLSSSAPQCATHSRLHPCIFAPSLATPLPQQMKFLSDGFADVTKVVKLDKHNSAATTLARTLMIANKKLASEMQSTVGIVDSLWLY
jgi:hypothetical protein